MNIIKSGKITILEIIEKHDRSQDVVKLNSFENSQQELNFFIANIDQLCFYGLRHCYHVLSKLNYIKLSNSTKIINPILGIGHILPQNPQRRSEWSTSFSYKQRETLTNKIQNLILTNGKKASKLGRNHFKKRKKCILNHQLMQFLTNVFINKYNIWDIKIN